MSLFEMRLFQDNLSTRWKGGDVYPHWPERNSERTPEITVL